MKTNQNKQIPSFYSTLLTINCSVKRCQNNVGYIQNLSFKGFLKPQGYFLRIGEIYCEKHKRYAKRLSTNTPKQ